MAKTYSTEKSLTSQEASSYIPVWDNHIMTFAEVPTSLLSIIPAEKTLCPG